MVQVVPTALQDDVSETTDTDRFEEQAAGIHSEHLLSEDDDALLLVCTVQNCISNKIFQVVLNCIVYNFLLKDVYMLFGF